MPGGVYELYPNYFPEEGSAQHAAPGMRHHLVDRLFYLRVDPLLHGSHFMDSVVMVVAHLYSASRSTEVASKQLAHMKSATTAYKLAHLGLQ